MIELKLQLEEFERELDLLLSGDENKLVVEELHIVFDAVDECLEETASLIAQRRLLRNFPLYFKFNLEEEERILQIGYTKFELLEGALNENPASVRQSGKLSEFTDAMETFQSHVKKENNEQWQVWVERLRSMFSVSDSELESARSNPRNQECVDKFERQKTNFNELVKSIPTNHDSFEKIDSAAEKLSSILNDIDFTTLPPKIANFYKFLREHGDFPLTRFDSEIAEWLKASGEDKLFSVKKRGLF